MLETIVSEKWITANAVFGLYPANASGDDIEIYADETRQQTLMTWHNLRLILAALRLLCARFGLTMQALISALLAAPVDHRPVCG